jgi:hypothetical protein
LEFPGTSITSFSQFVIAQQRAATTMMDVKVFIQGYTNANQKMNSALFNAGVSGATAGQADSLTIEIRSGVNGSLLRGPVKTILNTDGSASAAFPLATGSHYIVVKGRNALETWSAAPVLMGESVTYDFSASASSAYGSNLAARSGLYTLWSGDVNQDGVIESADYFRIENDVLSLLFGYYPADLTGDGRVDASDYSLIEENIIKIIFCKKPF